VFFPTFFRIVISLDESTTQIQYTGIRIILTDLRQYSEDLSGCELFELQMCDTLLDTQDGHCRGAQTPDTPYVLHAQLVPKTRGHKRLHIFTMSSTLIKIEIDFYLDGPDFNSRQWRLINFSTCTSPKTALRPTSHVQLQPERKVGRLPGLYIRLPSVALRLRD
jgi:hypothetical protein